MTPFLYKVASCFYDTYGTEINELAFVFPNRRAGLFFQKYSKKKTHVEEFDP